MSRSVVSALGLCAAVLSLTACQASKSSNPLSPSVAGPISGVNITAPKPLDPTVGSKIAADKQPLTLMIENASTSGVRPLSYVFEVATDSSFTNKVFARDSIAPGDGGRTSLRLPDPLATGRTYYWRARAQDGANASDYSTAVNFNVYTPIVIDVPNLLTPAPNATIDSIRPVFTVGDAPRSGPVGAITYQIELADSDSFANKIAVWTAPEQPNQTTLTPPQDLAYSTIYFWHVRAADPTTAGAWSRTQAFATPAAPATPPIPGPTPPTPTPSGPAPNDAINLATVTVHNSPSDVANWAPTATLTRLDLMPSGAHVEFSKSGVWPEVVPPGWSGGIQYTLWIVLNINGQWHASGCIEYWRGLYENGGPVSQYAQNWYFDPIRWGPMTGHQPAPGEQVGFFVTAGDARNNGPSSVKERSQVVMVPFPGNGGQSFTFAAAGLNALRYR